MSWFAVYEPVKRFLQYTWKYLLTQVSTQFLKLWNRALCLLFRLFRLRTTTTTTLHYRKWMWPLYTATYKVLRQLRRRLWWSSLVLRKILLCSTLLPLFCRRHKKSLYYISFYRLLMQWMVNKLLCKSLSDRPVTDLMNSRAFARCGIAVVCYYFLLY
jgi:hypothetical protein